MFLRYFKMLFILRVTTNKEDQAVDLIGARVREKKLGVLSIVRPAGLRGYILLESETRKDAEEAFHNLPYVKNLLPKTITFDEIKHMMETSMPVTKIKEGDIVEIVAGTLKRDKARVVRLNKKKEEVVEAEIVEEEKK